MEQTKGVIPFTTEVFVGRFSSIPVGLLCLAAGCAGAFIDMEFAAVMALMSLGVAITALGMFRWILQRLLARRLASQDTSGSDGD